MPVFVAFLRGIMPQNPNMRNDKIRTVFEKLGFQNVQSVIASGNIIFESDSTNTNTMETQIEKALMEHLGFSSTTIIRSQKQLEKMVQSNPFKSKTDSPRSRLNVSFLQKGGEIYSVIDPSITTTPKVMAELEKKHDKKITMRTWKTVQRILAQFKQPRYY